MSTTVSKSWFNSRRSVVYARHGMVACSQPLAAQVGLNILQKVAAALNVTEPCSTGIGGDAFALFYNAKTKKVEGLNATGRAAAGIDLDFLLNKAQIDASGNQIPFESVHAITVPGAAAGWCDSVKRWGTMPLSTILEPAIQLAEEGFPVAPLTAEFWDRGMHLLRKGEHGHEMMLEGKRAPRAGEIMHNPTLAQTFRTLAAEGADGFYKGRIGQEIINIIQAHGGVMTGEDLATHYSTFEEPIHVNYRGVDVYEMGPPGQGLAALLALNILQHLPSTSTDNELPPYGSVEMWHQRIEAMRFAFADARHFIADPAHVKVPVDELLSTETAKQRASSYRSDRRAGNVGPSEIKGNPDTVYFCVVDGEGNACSFINSNYMGFGSGLIPKGCGFTLHNRGSNFNLTRGTPNCIAPKKRPYNTIIPGMAMKDGELFAAFGVMGAFNQPQGHLQVLSNMIDYGMNPQQALDAPRFCIRDGFPTGPVCIEEDVDEEIVNKLTEMGQSMERVFGFERFLFGRGQIIRRNPVTGVLTGGSDPRSDGHAVGY